MFEYHTKTKNSENAASAGERVEATLARGRSRARAAAPRGGVAAVRGRSVWRAFMSAASGGQRAERERKYV